MKIFFITHNENRKKELKKTLETHFDIALVDSLFDLEKNVDLNINERNLESRAEIKVERVWKEIKDEYDYVICEEFGLFLEYAPNIIGVDHKRWWPGTDRDRNEALIRLFDGIKDRKIFYKSVFVAKNKKGEVIKGIGYTRGFLGRKIKEKNGIGYDSVFAIEGRKHLSQYSLEEIKEFNASNKSLEELVRKINHRNN